MGKLELGLMGKLALGQHNWQRVLLPRELPAARPSKFVWASAALLQT